MSPMLSDDCIGGDHQVCPEDHSPTTICRCHCHDPPGISSGSKGGA